MILELADELIWVLVAWVVFILIVICYSLIKNVYTKKEDDVWQKWIKDD